MPPCLPLPFLLIIKQDDKMIRSATAIIALFLLTFFSGESKAEKPPNFIIIFADDLGYGDLGCYGSTVNPTPHIDQLANEGVRFTDFYSAAPLCTPARAALLTGSYPVRIGMARTHKGECVCFPVDETGLHPDEITIAELLKDVNYATALIGKWHLGDQPEFFPTKQGFDQYFGIPYSNDTGKGWFGHRGKRQLYEHPVVPLMRGDSVIEAPVKQNTITKRYTEEAISFIETHSGEPFFLYLSHTMPHYPLSVSPEFENKTGNGLYSNVIAELDWSVGEIVEALEENGLRDNTLLIFTSDNGATGGYGYNTTNAPLSGHKGSAMEGGNRVPMIASWPGIIPSGVVTSAMGSVMDLLPTFAYYAGTLPPADRVIDGKSLHEVLDRPEDAESPHAWYAYYVTDQLQAIRTKEWKLHLPLVHSYTMWAKDVGPVEAKLYRISEDIAEENDLSDEYPEMVETMQVYAEMARQWVGDRNRPTPQSRPAGYVEKPVPLQKTP